MGHGGQPDADGHTHSTSVAGGKNTMPSDWHGQSLGGGHPGQ